MKEKYFLIRNSLPKKIEFLDFFHFVMKKHHYVKRIAKLKNELGNWVESQDEIKNLLLDSFQKHFQSQHVTSLPSNNESYSDLHSICFVSLNATVKEAEILSVLKDMNPNVSPDSDGFGAHFYLTYWSIVGQEVSLAVKSFFFHGFLTPQH